MQNVISLDFPPERLILNPFQSPNIGLVGPMTPLWRVLPAARIHGLGAPEPRPLSRQVEVATLALHLTDLWLRPSGITLGGRSLLSGVAGLAHLDQIAAQSPLAQTALIAHFTAEQSRPVPRQIPPRVPSPDTPIVLQPGAVTQTLAQLCLIRDLGLTGPIHLFDTPGLRAFLAALFPDLAPRVSFDPISTHLAEAIAPTAFSPALYLMSDADCAVFEHELPLVALWEGRRATRASMALLAAHSVDASLFRLRAHGLSLVAPAQPRRFWLTEDPALQAMPELTEMLRLFGFQPVTLNRFSPLEQIALFAGAEMVVAPTAFLLLFAPATATAISLTPDPAFNAAVTVAGCRLLQTQGPLTRLDLARLMSLIVTLLGETPEFHDPAEVQILAQTLILLGEHAAAAALFKTHAPLAHHHAGLALAMADLAERRDDQPATLAALQLARAADPTDWAVLIRTLLTARALDQPDLVSSLLAALHDDFPENFDAFARSRPWVRDFFSPNPA